MKKIKQIEVPSEVISDECYKSIRQELAAKKNALRNAPNFRLKSFGDKALLSTNPKHRQPLMLDDIQYLLMNALLGGSSPFKPGRWAVFEKVNKLSHTVILVIEGLSSYSFSANESRFEKTKKIFTEQMEVVLPKCTKNRIIEELCFIPLTQAHKEKLIKQYGSLEAAVHLNKEHHLITKSMFPIHGDLNEDDNGELPTDESFPRTRLLLSPLQMMIEGYPMPLSGEFAERYREFRYTRESYKPVTKKSPMFGLDCEMCKTVKAENELARVSIVDENYESVYETLVRPTNRIVDYLTAWSGITKEMMQDVTKTLQEVQEEVKNVLPPDAILVGQSLNCDLSAMKLMHPYVIDTSVIFNLTGDRNRKSKLQMLAKTFLGEDIQMSTSLGHSSIEDSTASLKLTKLKLSKDIYYGDCALQTKRKIEEKTSYTGIVNTPVDPADNKEVATTLLSHALKRQKKTAIITSSSTDFDLTKFYSRNQFDALQNEGGDSPQHGIQHHKESSAKTVINKTREVIVDNDFNLSHFNILEDFLHEGDGTADASTADEKIVKSIDQVDEWIHKVWESVAHNGLFVVIFGGHEKNPNGVSMVRIKN